MSESDAPKTSPAVDAPTDFVHEIVQADVAAGKHDGRVGTRFPPEPNGYLHIGHAKSICLNFGIARDFGGTCNLRFDDTNPTTEDPEYVEAIQRDVRWLGFEWNELRHASDYFEQLYGFAVRLIEKGKAYVDSSSQEEIRAQRGTISVPGTPSRFRDRSAQENLDLFARMRAGEFDDGTHVLRAKIDMSAANMLLRDPILYRIRKASHYRTGDAWAIYPMYDFAHCLSDAIEGITHSVCTLEFENNRAVYDWLVEQVGFDDPPHQYEFARLNLSYTMMSKRKLLQLVQEERVSGWDDPRMPTLSAMRRRGVTPEAIRALCHKVGVAKTYNVIDLALLEHCVRDDLNQRAPRAMTVLQPLEVVIENYPEGETETFDAPLWPHDVPKQGSRPLGFGRTFYIERDDFQEDPPAGYHRLAPGREVRLRYAYLVRCTGVDRDAAGEVVRVRCTYDPETRGGNAPDGRKVKGTIHWVAAHEAAPVEVRLYDRLFEHEAPGTGDGDFRDQLNPGSLEIVDALAEPMVASAETGARFQFERLGYFYRDPDTTDDGRPVFNRTVTLRDSWAKVTETEDVIRRRDEAQRKAEAKVAAKAAQRAASAQAGAGAPSPVDPAHAAEHARLTALGVGDAEARVLVQEPGLVAYFEAARRVHDAPQALGSWIVNEVRRIRRERGDDAPALGSEALAELVSLLDRGTITTTVAKEVLAQVAAGEGMPRAIVEEKGLAQLSGDDALAPLVAAAIAGHPAQAKQYRSGKHALIGFFVGQVMKASRGRADAQRVRALLEAALAEA